MAHFIIYGLHDPRTGELRYVGKSIHGITRARRHSEWYELKDKSHKTNWIKGLVSDGLRPDISVLEEYENGDGLADMERLAIAHYRAMGFDLTNQTDGGEGAPGYRASAETRAKMSAAKRGRPLPPFTPEHRANMGASRRGKRLSPEHRAALSAAKTGTKYSPQHCAAISKSLQGRAVDNSHWIGRKHSEETKAKIRAKLIGNKNNRFCKDAES